MSNAALAVQLLLALLQRAQDTGNLIAQAQASGVDITDDQLNALVAADDAAKAALSSAIATARGAKATAA